MLTNRRRHKKRIESLAGHVAVRPSTTQQRYQVVSWTGTRSFSETQDTGVLLTVLQEIWPEVPDLKPLRVGIALSNLARKEDHQPDLFDKPSDARLVTAIDELNAKFGKGAITYGAATADQTSKVAFQRVPKVKEF